MATPISSSRSLFPSLTSRPPTDGLQLCHSVWRHALIKSIKQLGQIKRREILLLLHSPSFFSFYLCMCTHMCMWTHVHVCRENRREWACPQSLLHVLCFRFSHWFWRLLIRLDLATMEPHGCPGVCPRGSPELRLQACSCTCIFIWVLGIWIQVLTLTQQALYPLRHLSSPSLHLSWYEQILYLYVYLHYI